MQPNVRQLSVMVTGKREESEFASVMAVEVQPDQHSQQIAMLTARLREESEFACEGRCLQQNVPAERDDDW